MSDEVLLEMARTLGRIEQKIDGNATTLSKHMDDDKEIARALFGRIETLQASSNRQKGFMSALATVGTALGAGVGYLVERWTNGHH